MSIVPASIRNRNAGAQYPGKSAKKFGSSSFETLTSRDGVHKIATFPSHVQGASAMFDLLDQRYTGMTVEKAITKWCGAFYVSTYIKVLEDKGGVKRSDILTKDLLRDPEKAIPLARAMALQEAGRDYPMTGEEWQQAHACAFVEPIAPAFSADNDVPSPKAEMRTAAIVAKVKKVIAGGSGVGALGAVATDPAALTAKLSAYKELTAILTSFGPWMAAGMLAVGAAFWVWKGQ
jgi:hypothetical protein